MMESIALNESQIVVEMETDFVIVEADEMEIDDDEQYDLCDDVFSTDAPLQSSSVSVGSSDIYSIEQALELETLDEEENEVRGSGHPRGVSVVSLEDAIGEPEKKCSEEDVVITASDPPSVDPPVAMELQHEEKDEERGDDDEMIKAKEVSRLSNKKRRRKAKQMKKAAAAAAAALALAEISKGGGTPTKKTSIPSKPRQTSKSSRSSKKKLPNLAVACATESLSDFREKHNIKGPVKQNLVALL